MTTRTQLLMLAATLAPLPLYAQEADPAPSAVCAPAAPSAQLPAEYAPLAPLAILPADADAAIVLPGFGDVIGFIFDDAEDDVNAQACGSLAIAGGKGFNRAYNLLQYLSIFAPAVSDGIVTEIAKDWASVAKQELRGTIIASGESIQAGNIEKFRTTFSQCKFAPVYVAMNIPAGQEEVVEAGIQVLLADAKDSAEHDEDLSFVTFGQLSGLAITFPKEEGASANLEVSGEEEEGVVCVTCRPVEVDPIDAIVEEELSKRTMYVLLGVVNGNAVAVLCEDPADIHFAETPEQSLLFTETWSAVKPNLGGDIHFAAYMSPEMCNAGAEGWTAYTELLSGASQVFDAMAEKDPASAETYKAASFGISTIVSELNGMVPVCDTPLFFQVWSTPGAIHVDFTCDACGSTFAPAKLTLADKGSAEGTIFYLESTPYHNGIQMPDGQKLCSAGTAVFNGITASLSPDLQPMVQEGIEQVAVFLPDLCTLCTATGNIFDGMGGTCGLVIDGNGTAPAYLFEGESAALPRVAVFSGVANREKIAQGWEDLLAATASIMEKCGQDSAMIAMLPIVPTPVGDAVSYTVAIPGILTPDLGANVTISDTFFTAGSSSNLNQELATLASGSTNQEFCGVVFTLRPAPLAATARSIADAMLKTAGPIAQTGFKFTPGEGWVQCPADEVDPDADDAFLVNDPPPAQRDALDMNDFAENCEILAQYVKEINGTMTIKDDVETLHMDIILKDAQ